MKRSRMKSRKQAVDWSDALEKVYEENRCRVCGITGGSTVDGEPVRLEAAHVIERSKSDEMLEGPRGGKIRRVPRDAIVPLCSSDHRAYDARRLDLMPFLLLPEALHAVRVCGSIPAANKRISGSVG